MYKKRFSDRGDRGDRRPGKMYPVTCSNCGTDCEVPFKPFSGKPVFCRDCFKKNDDTSFSNERTYNDRPYNERPRFSDQSDGDRAFRDYRDDSRPAPKVRGNFRGTCNSCGDECSVPFRPEPGRALFCPKCFGKGMNASGKGAEVGISKEQFQMLNDKMDKILKILELATQDMDEAIDMDEELEPVKPAKASKAPTRGQKKRAKRTGKTE